MAWCDRGVQTLLAIVGAFGAFSLMTIAIGTDYWLYSRAYICNATNATTDETQMQTKKVKGDLTHSGLWRICCIEGKTKYNKLITIIPQTFFCLHTSVLWHRWAFFPVFSQLVSFWLFVWRWGGDNMRGLIDEIVFKCSINEVKLDFNGCFYWKLGSENTRNAVRLCKKKSTRTFATNIS